MDLPQIEKQVEGPEPARHNDTMLDVTQGLHHPPSLHLESLLLSSAPPLASARLCSTLPTVRGLPLPNQTASAHPAAHSLSLHVHLSPSVSVPLSVPPCLFFLSATSATHLRAAPVANPLHRSTPRPRLAGIWSSSIQTKSPQLP